MRIRQHVHGYITFHENLQKKEEGTLHSDKSNDAYPERSTHMFYKEMFIKTKTRSGHSEHACYVKRIYFPFIIEQDVSIKQAIYRLQEQSYQRTLLYNDKYICSVFINTSFIILICITGLVLSSMQEQLAKNL